MGVWEPQEEMLCPTCSGMGMVLFDKGTTSDTDATCPDCKGRGKVKTI